MTLALLGMALGCVVIGTLVVVAAVCAPAAWRDQQTGWRDDDERFD